MNRPFEHQAPFASAAASSLRRAALLAAAMTLAACPALAQGAATAAPPPSAFAQITPVGPFPPVGPAAKLDDVVVKGAAAKRAHERSILRLDVAERIAKVCLAQAARNNLSVTVHIIDQYGEPIYTARMDGQYSVNIDTAIMKAKTALYLRDSTHAQANRSADDVNYKLLVMQLGQYDVSGGLPIIVEDQLLGAIGVGGGRLDEACAYEALQTVLGPQQPLTPTLPPRAR
jgi:glc operon protein GlcG